MDGALCGVCVCVHMCVCAIDTMRGDPRQIAKFINTNSHVRRFSVSRSHCGFQA